MRDPIARRQVVSGELRPQDILQRVLDSDHRFYGVFTTGLDGGKAVAGRDGLRQRRWGRMGAVQACTEPVDAFKAMELDNNQRQQSPNH